MKEPNYTNPLSEEETREITDKVTRFGAVLVAISIILFVYTYKKLAGSTWQIMLFITATLLLLFGLFLIITIQLGTRSEKSHRNYFLYDKKAKQDRAPESLTVSYIRRRIDDYMSAFRFRGKLYLGDLFAEEQRIPEVFKPLFCYELLCQVAEDRQKAAILLSFGEDCAAVFRQYLTESEDSELAHAVSAYIHNYEEDDATGDAFWRYLSDKKEQLENKMRSYTLQNIEKF